MPSVQHPDFKSSFQRGGLCGRCRLRAVSLGSEGRLLLALDTLEVPPGLVPRPLLRGEAVIHPPAALCRKERLAGLAFT